MDMIMFTLILVVIAALIFDYVNGFHDTANAIATVVSTGVLPVNLAVIMAGVLNWFGAMTGTAVAGTIGSGIVEAAAVSQVLVLSALIGAIVWNLLTWYFGIPSSSSHALIGGLIGAAIAKGGFSIIQQSGVVKILIVMVSSPLAGFVIGLGAMITIARLFYRSNPARSRRTFRILQLISSCFMAFSHGSNDAQKSMGVITMALVSASMLVTTEDKFPVPMWVKFACATAIALGTTSGGKRIIKTMGSKIIELRPVHGFAAEMSAAATIFFASHFGLPVSTTHVISTAIIGVGATENPSAVRWGVTVKIVWAWILTIPMSALVACGCYYILRPILEP